ncbi:helix-turn-helix domain-containing protein [Gammaproteobacteria bacterium]|nr:helix-turn-helix domain-containing protein [Gammaproteobacteria bacterium]
MPYQVEYIAAALKKARKAKKLSQTELGAKVGLPQSHVSKIESGRTDLKLSSLIELARMLDLELTLVPRKLLPAVQSLVRGSSDHTVRVPIGELKLQGHPPTVAVTPAYSLDEDEDDA